MRLSPLVVALALVAISSFAQTEDAALRRARELLKKTILIDGHNDLPWAIRNAETAPRDVVAYDLRKRTPGDTDFERLQQGGLGAQFWSVYIPGDIRPLDTMGSPLNPQFAASSGRISGDDKASGYAKVQLEQIDIARRVIALYPDKLGLALRSDDIERVYRSGRIASLLGMEGGHAIENSLGALRAYYDLGVRYMTLTHNVTLAWADAANDKAFHGGLTRFGEEVVREMNRLGMLVDLSHTSPEVMDDTLRVSEAPVIFSHSSARAICDVPRNVPDAVLKQMPKNGGVVMVVFVAGFVSQEFATAVAPFRKEITTRSAGVKDAAERERISREVMAKAKLPRVTIGQVADHIEHIRKVAGVDHVGLGADYDGASEWPAGLEDVSKYPYLFAELIRRGWSDADLSKLAGENVLRAMRGAEATARKLQAARPASTATIEELDPQK